MEVPEYTRLHITPFNAGLLKVIIPPSILPNARSISYHSILTFPEKAYGYVELPTMDAEKIKKKLNGTTLKGMKVRIETARPEKEIVIEEEEEPERPQRARKSKRKRDELPGVDIGERQVKRGWTTPAKDAKKDQPVIKSKYTTEPECLFKTNLPPNVASRGKIAEKLAEPKPDRKKRKPGKEAIIHEFAKTTKYATFLRGSGVSNSSRIVVEFVEGKGWVDEEGNVVEEARKSKKIIKAAIETIPEPKEQDVGADLMEVDVVDPIEKEENSSPSSTSSEDSESESISEVEAPEETEQPARAREAAQLQNATQSSSSESSSSDSEDDQMNESISSSEESSDDDFSPNVRSSPTRLSIQHSAVQESSSSDDSSDESIAEAQSPNETSSTSSDSSDDSDSSDESDADSEVAEPQSALTVKSQGSTGPSLSIKIPESVTSTPIASSVHPLEALYKRPKSGMMDPLKAVESSFSFFGADGDEDIEEAHLQVPLTPFTQKDFEYRGLRSAAPTPDTAHANKRFIWPSEKDEEEDDDEAAPSSPIRKAKKEESKEKTAEPQTDFQKWFYENRGDVRRAWTGRKRAAAKEKRQRENRKRDHRAI